MSTGTKSLYMEPEGPYMGPWAPWGPGSRTKDAGSRTKDPGSRTKDPGPRTKDLGPRIQDPGPRIQDQGSRTKNRVPGSKDQDPRSKVRGSPYRGRLLKFGISFIVIPIAAQQCKLRTGRIPLNLFKRVYPPTIAAPARFEAGGGSTPHSSSSSKHLGGRRLPPFATIAVAGWKGGPPPCVTVPVRCSIFWPD